MIVQSVALMEIKAGAVGEEIRCNLFFESTNGRINQGFVLEQETNQADNFIE